MAAGSTIQLKRTKIGTVPTSLAPGELQLDYVNGLIYWQALNGTINNVPFTVAGIIAAVGAQLRLLQTRLVMMRLMQQMLRHL